MTRSLFDGFRKQLAANIGQFYLDVLSGLFHGLNQAGAKVFETIIRNWWRRGKISGIKVQYDCIKPSRRTSPRT